MQLCDIDVEKIRTWAAKHPEIGSVFLYGSRARDEARPDSDIDLAVEMPWTTWFNWHNKFKSDPDLNLGAPIHLECLDEDLGSEVVGPAVKKEGIRLYP